MFTRISLDNEVLSDLDRFGFRADKLEHEFELDTLHVDERKGFHSFDSLNFIPYKFLEFKEGSTLIIDREYTVSYRREFKRIKFNHNGVTNLLEIAHLGGTQDIFLKPITQCGCDSLIVPYMSVVWADRVRQAIVDEERF